MKGHKHTVVTSNKALARVYEHAPRRVIVREILSEQFMENFCSQQTIYGEVPRGHTPPSGWTVVTPECMGEHRDEVMRRLNVRMVDPAWFRRKAAWHKG